MMFTTRTLRVCVSNPNLMSISKSISFSLGLCRYSSPQWKTHHIFFLSKHSPWDSIKKKIPPLFFDWRIIALQYCAGFRHTATWISHKNQPPIDICPVSLEPALISLSIHPCVVSELWVELPANSHLVSISHMVMYMFPCSSLNLSHLLLLPLGPQVRSLCLHLHCCLANLSL